MGLRTVLLQRDGSFIGGERFVITSKLCKQIAAADLVAVRIRFHTRRFVITHKRFVVARQSQKGVTARV